MQCNPIIVDSILYGVSTGTQVFAIDAATGKRLWHFQFVHHDIGDREPPALPDLLTVLHDEKQVDTVAQTTKQGHVFVFDRVSTYAIGGNQYIVIACGGGKLNTRSSDKYVAFRLEN